RQPLSRLTTVSPARFTSMPHARPVGPAPTTSTSKRSGPRFDPFGYMEIAYRGVRSRRSRSPSVILKFSNCHSERSEEPAVAGRRRNFGLREIHRPGRLKERSIFAAARGKQVLRCAQNDSSTGQVTASTESCRNRHHGVVVWARMVTKGELAVPRGAHSINIQSP